MQSSNWQPSAELAVLKRRAQLLADVRLFFAERHVLEVETPILSTSAPTAPYLDSFHTELRSLEGESLNTLYLQTSPEFTMKRLLAAGYGSIYQVCKVFRNGEAGGQHSPEFTMLEWYRPELDFEQLINEVDQLLQHVASTAQARRLSYQSVFKEYLAIDVFTCSDKQIQQLVLTQIKGASLEWDLSRDDALELLMSQLIEPKLAELGVPVFIYDFPASQAQLAKIMDDEQGNQVAKRFELYASGMELANGYDELLDADELAKRFAADNISRQHQNKPMVPVDENLLTAMRAGLPQCTGVALGLDRLMMLISKKKHISTVQSLTIN
jgi:lysyl-tRNA synthetase class 2